MNFKSCSKFEKQLEILVNYFHTIPNHEKCIVDGIRKFSPHYQIEHTNLALNLCLNATIFPPTPFRCYLSAVFCVFRGFDKRIKKWCKWKYCKSQPALQLC